MPNSYLKKLAEDGYGTLSTLEKKWEDAKSTAKDQGKPDNYGLITYIFKQMIGASIDAKARLQATSAEEEYRRTLADEMLGDTNSMPEDDLLDSLGKPGLPVL